MKKFSTTLLFISLLTISGFAETTAPTAPQTTTVAPPSSPKTPSVQPAVPLDETPSDLCEDQQKISDNLTYENMFMKTVLALVGLLLLVFLAIWVLRKLSSSRTRQMNLLKTVKVLEKRPISPKSILYLVEVAGRKVLISESQLEVRTISHLDWIDLPPPDVK